MSSRSAKPKPRRPSARGPPPARGGRADERDDRSSCPRARAGRRGGDELAAVRVVWRRELLRFERNHLRMVTSLVQPLLFLFILGGGLSNTLPSSGHVNFRTLRFPGILAMTVLFTSRSSALSNLWDREFGFLREMLVAPVHRGAIVLGKCAGGVTVATLQGIVISRLRGRTCPTRLAAADAGRRDVWLPPRSPHSGCSWPAACNRSSRSWR